MKHYPKRYQNHFKDNPLLRPEFNGCALDSFDEYKARFRALHGSLANDLFSFVVRHAWLEAQFTHKGKRRGFHRANGVYRDMHYGRFMMQDVGVSQKPLTMNFFYTVILTYLPDLFPDFLMHDPEKEPEYYKYPYEHVTLDFLMFVYQHHERLEMLAYAEEKKMTHYDFVNWAINQVLCHNDEVGEVLYEIKLRTFLMPVIAPRVSRHKHNTTRNMNAGGFVVQKSFKDRRRETLMKANPRRWLYEERKRQRENTA